MSPPPADRYWIVPRDKPGLLVAMMKALAGDAHVSFEGDLTRCAFPAELSPSPQETPSLRRHTAYPRQDFVVLPLTPMSVRPILDVVLPGNWFMRDVLHVQIEQGGALRFGAYDNFDPDCVVGYPGVPTTLLDRLRGSGVIRSWTLPFDGAQRWHG